jgi:hypothetical protein
MCWRSYLPVSRRAFHQLVVQVLKIMSTQAEVVAEVVAVKEQLVKVQGETQSLLDKIAALTAVVEAGGAASPELIQAVADLKAQANVVDALVNDAP